MLDQALATVVGPTLLFQKDGPVGNIENIHLVNRLTSLLILQHEWLFEEYAHEDSPENEQVLEEDPEDQSEEEDAYTSP